MELNTIEKSSEAPISARTNDSALDEIAFATGETELGTVLIARSSVGVCSIIMGSDGDELSNESCGAFPGEQAGPRQREARRRPASGATLHRDAGRRP